MWSLIPTGYQLLADIQEVRVSVECAASKRLRAGRHFTQRNQHQAAVCEIVWQIRRHLLSMLQPQRRYVSLGCRINT